MRKVLVLLVLGMVVLQIVSFDVKGEEYQSISGQVKMKERWLKVTVYYYKGDEQWAKHALSLSINALPIIEELSGFTYPHNYDVIIKEKMTAEEAGGWGGMYSGAGGILAAKSNCGDSCLIHENAHAWTGIYEKKWMGEGYANFYAYLTLEKLNNKYETDSLKIREINNFIKSIKTYDWSLDDNFYTSPKPDNWTEEDEKRRTFCYGKSFVFVYILYKEFGIEILQKANSLAGNTKYNSSNFKASLERLTGKQLDDFFSGWIYEGMYKVYSPRDFYDNDEDSLINFDEKFLKTNPNNPDSDNDGIGDRGEIELGTDPLDSDTDRDGVSDEEEIGIVIDGIALDWQKYEKDELAISDPEGDIQNFENNQGIDLKSVSLVMDNDFLYVKLEIFGKLNNNLTRNYYISPDYNNDEKEEYYFGFRPNGDVWFVDLTKDKKNRERIWYPDGMEAWGIKNILEVKIPCSKFNIPEEFYVYSWITENKGKMVDWTDWKNFEGKKVPRLNRNPLIPDSTEIQKDTFERISKLFNQALRIFDSGNYQKAKEVFIKSKEEFQGINYPMKVRETEKWIKMCDEKIEIQRLTKEADDLFLQAQQEFANQNYKIAKDLFEQVKTKYQNLENNSKTKEADQWIVKCYEKIIEQQQSPASQPPQPQKTSIPILSIIFAILLVYLRKKVTK